MTATLIQKRIRMSREEFLQLPEGYLLVSTTPPSRPFEPKRFPGLKLALGATFGKNGGSSLRSE